MNKQDLKNALSKRAGEVVARKAPEMMQNLAAFTTVSSTGDYTADPAAAGRGSTGATMTTAENQKMRQPKKK